MAKIQLRVVKDLPNSIWTPPNLKPGEVVWVDDGDPARHLIEHGYCELPMPAPMPETSAELVMWPSRSAPVDRFARIEPVWNGKTVVCIGGGPSLTLEQLQVVERARAANRCRVVVVNDGYLIAPYADILYAADHRWWEWQVQGQIKEWPWAKFTPDQVRDAFDAFKGQRVTIYGTGQMVKDPNIFMLQNESDAGQKRGLSELPNALRTGANGGYQAINLAFLAGGNPIYLLGYDMRFHGKRSHSHNGHRHQVAEQAYLGWARNFQTMLPQLQRRGVTVVNCSPGTAIDAFPRGDIARLLADS